MKITKQRTSLLSVLIFLTFTAVALQITLFTIHYRVAGLLDSLAASTLDQQLLHAPILLPLIGFVILQIISYSLLITWIWFITNTVSKSLKLPTYELGIAFWLLTIIAILTLNNHFYPNSFFSKLLQTEFHLSTTLNNILAYLSCTLLIIASTLAYYQFFRHKQHRITGGIFLVIALITTTLTAYDQFTLTQRGAASAALGVNVILIGLDSVRPDFVHHFGNTYVHTPHIDAFLASAGTFTDAYTPLGRTFPSWISILTGQYPKHTHIRNNLTDASVLKAKSLGKILQAHGYQTIYATDEKRFSNITTDFGFDKIIGPAMGVNDFILGGLNDFPLTNLFINLTIGKTLFPFNYGNRAANITYYPENFLNLVKLNITQNSKKPLFLAVHLCTTHWPYTWARDHQQADFSQAQRYQASVEEIDKQLGELLAFFKTRGLLENTIVVLLSDHGTGLGLVGDRLIKQNYYRGDPEKLKWLPRFALSNAIPQKYQPPRLDTSYGQGTDVLSLQQQHVVLAFKLFGMPQTARNIATRSSLIDIMPTLLDFLHLSAIPAADGISLKPFLLNSAHHIDSNRSLLSESGYTVSEIETNHIDAEKVLQKNMGIYRINPHNGLLTVIPTIEQSYQQSKQRAILQGDWLLARMPTSVVHTLAQDKNHQLYFKYFTLPTYYVLVNIKTHEWTIGLNSALAMQAPVKKLLAELKDFYGDEV